MAVYKINEDFYDDSFLLIAIHSSLEDYTLVYHLNKTLKTNFKRSNTDFDLSENSSFPWFDWVDQFNDRYWVLVANQSTKQELQVNNDLFQNETTYSRPRLVPEYKEVDYFLKIEEEEGLESDEIIKVLTKMPKVITAYAVSTDKLKSKKNLIF
ncbi:IPExxxVDY family protein [Maribacter chungangensis]|uniref:IPExxxVDY family protein n=1 Tax=Maribacter chungangensis TaxID=1069117 RepID=A0ABW3B9Z8_9FLAO